MNRIRSLLWHPITRVGLAVGALALVVALALFQPWKLWVDASVDEAAPVAAKTGDPVVLATGTFISHEHDTTGTVSIVRAPDGSRYVRIENLDTSNGPQLKVWLTDAPVLSGTAGRRIFDDGRYVDLGDLKGNMGSQNYALPADVDLNQYRSISIWCDRFNVSFGAAGLVRA